MDLEKVGLQFCLKCLALETEKNSIESVLSSLFVWKGRHSQGLQSNAKQYVFVKAGQQGCGSHCKCCKNSEARELRDRLHQNVGPADGTRDGVGGIGLL